MPDRPVPVLNDKDRPVVESIDLFGDSLSDRGTLYKNKMMIAAAGFSDVMNGDSFTNGYPWSDQFIANVANDLTVQQLKKVRKFASDNALTNDQISDAILDNDPAIKPILQNTYNLDSDTSVDFKGHRLLRSHAVGGLTAHHYGFSPLFEWSWRIFGCFFARLLLTSLSDQRKLFLKDDQKKNRTPEEKAKTLIVEWSGANDLITVNVKPNEKAVNLAINDRIKNARVMVQNGYKNFVLFNMPDLSLTPRFQAKSVKEQMNARIWCHYFNTRLKNEVAALQREFPDCKFEIFDASSQYRDVFENPEKYGFDRAKRDKAFIKSDEFKLAKGKPVPSKGYMSWDDIHPTADLHAVLAKKLYEFVKTKFNFKFPCVNQAKPSGAGMFKDGKIKRVASESRLVEREVSCLRR